MRAWGILVAKDEPVAGVGVVIVPPPEIQFKSLI